MLIDGSDPGSAFDLVGSEAYSPQLTRYSLYKLGKGEDLVKNRVIDMQQSKLLQAPRTSVMLH